MKGYDPSAAPEAAAWLALPEAERHKLVVKHHKTAKIEVRNVNGHATAHALVETQLAEGLPAARAALARLLAGGVGRHEAVHALGSVLMTHLWNLANRPVPEGDPNAPYAAALDHLTVESWRSSR
jgi:hypothetical protein